MKQLFIAVFTIVAANNAHAADRGSELSMMADALVAESNCGSKFTDIASYTTYMISKFGGGAFSAGEIEIIKRKAEVIEPTVHLHVDGGVDDFCTYASKAFSLSLKTLQKSR